MIKSKLVGKQFKTLYAFDIVLSDLNDLIFLESHELEWRRKSQIVIRREKNENRDSLTNKPSIPRVAGFVKGTCNLNDFYDVRILKHIESIPGVNTLIL